jgi:hypothetical protein
VYTRTCAHTHRRTHTHARTHTQTHAHTQARTHTDTHTDARTHARTHTDTYTHTDARTHARTHTDTYTHTDARTHARAHAHAVLVCSASSLKCNSIPLTSEVLENFTHGDFTHCFLVLILKYFVLLPFLKIVFLYMWLRTFNNNN